MDFSIANHPDAAKIHATITALLKGIDDTAVALADLSNIPNMRHGGSLDWGTLERQHAAMLGGLCDALVSFLFDVAWRRPAAGATAPEPDRYEDFSAFNAWLDDEHRTWKSPVRCSCRAKSCTCSTPTQYEAARMDWEAQQAIEAAGQEAR